MNDSLNSSAKVECSTETLPENSGIKIICNGDSIGYVLNGINGENGTDGKDGINGSDGKDGTDGINGTDGEDGKSCTVIPLEDLSGFKVMCGEDSLGVLLNGTNGKDGTDGKDGLDGKDGKDGENGVDGVDGKNGVNGKDGEDGTSCTVAPLADNSGYKVLCGGDSTGVLLNGKKGEDGSDGYAPTVNVTEVAASTEHANGGIQIVVSYKDALGIIISDTTYVWNGADGKEGPGGPGGATGDDGYSPTVNVTEIAASTEHPNGGTQIVVSYKDAEGNVKADTTCVWNGKDGKEGSDGFSSKTQVTEIAASTEHPNGGLQIISTYKDAEGNDKADTNYIWNGANGSPGADGYAPTVNVTDIAASAEHPNGGIQIVVTYKDAEGNVQADTTYVWNGNDGKDLTPSSSSAESSNSAESSSATSSSSESSSSEGSSAESSSATSSSSVDVCETIRATKDDFVPIEDVLPCVKNNEKIIYVVRHSDRNDGTNYGSDLNALGFVHAKALGKRLQGTPDFFYMSTGTRRTGQTAYYVGLGKGQTGLDSAAMVNNSNEASGYYSRTRHDGGYWRPGRSWNENSCNAGTASDGSAYYDEHGVYTYYAYYPDRCSDNFASLTDRINEFLNDYATYDKMHNITFSVAHDQFVIVFLIHFTDKAINMAFHESSVVWDPALPHDQWTNFLSGFAFIVDENNNRTFIPVKGLDSGRYQGTTVNK